MDRFDFVFVILVYKNTSDLISFFHSLKVANSKVIVVNSYFDETTEKEFESIAKRNNADFFTVDNKGYGAGNNAGCVWALKKYKFEYLIISNADILIKKLSIGDVHLDVVNAPMIKNTIGHMSNPMQPYNIPFFEKIKYNCFKTNNNIWKIKLCIAINSFLRILYRISHLKGGAIYMSHGSFLILPYNIIYNLTPIYNEQQFLFCEEDHLAHLLYRGGYKTYYNPSIEVLHKEDGSVGGISDRVYEMTRKSYITFYEYWHKK